LDAFKQEGANRSIELLDSLAIKSLTDKQYTNFLFYRNQQVKFLIYTAEYKKAAETAIKSRGIFAKNHDTLHIEYITSYQEQSFVRNEYAKEYKPSRQEMLFRRLSIAEAMGYQDSLSRENPYVDALSHIINYFYYNDNKQEFFRYGKMARDYYKKVNFYGALAIFDRLIYDLYWENQDFSTTVRTALEANNAILKELQKEKRAWKEKLAFKSNRQSLISYALNEKQYTKLIPVLLEIDSTMLVENWTSKLWANIDLVECYYNTGDSSKLNIQIEKCIDMLQHKNISKNDRRIAYSKLSNKVSFVNQDLCHVLIDTAINMAVNTNKYYKMISNKFITYYNQERYKEAVELCNENLPIDSSSVHKIIDFSFSDYGDMFLENEIMARCYYLLWKEHGRDAKNLEYFEIYALKALDMYKAIYEYYMTSLEFNTFQYSYNEFVYVFLLSSLSDEIPLSLIDKETVVEAFSMVKAQSINNSLARLKGNSQFENSKRSNIYHSNLNEIQKQKTFLNKLSDAEIKQEDVIKFSDLLFENARLRYEIKKDGKSNKRNLLVSNENDSLSYLRRIQASLKPNQVMIDYMIDEAVNHCFCVLISSDTVYVSCTKDSTDRKLGSNFLRSIKTGGVDISVILTPCSGHVDPPHRFWFKEQVT